MLNLVDKGSIWIEDDPDFKVENVVHTNRVGIDSAGKEFVDKLYRFYIFGNSCVSKRDVLKENSMMDRGIDREDV